MKLIGVLLLLFVAIVGIVFAGGVLEAPQFDTVADYHFDVEPVAIEADVELAEWVCTCGRRMHRGRLTSDYARPTNARLAGASYDQCEPIRSRDTARGRFHDKTVNHFAVTTCNDRRHGALTGRFAGAPA